LSRIKKIVLYFSLSLIVFLSAYIIENKLLEPTYYQIDIDKFQADLYKKQLAIEELCVDLKNKLQTKSYDSIINDESEFYSNLLKNKGLALLVYESDSLRFWSDNAISASALFSDSKFYNPIIYLKNAWYYIDTLVADNKIIVGLILIKMQYSYENNFLKNIFQKDFDLPSDISISIVPYSEGNAIKDIKGNYLFSLIPPFKIYSNSLINLLVVIFYSLSFIFLLFLFKHIIRFSKTIRFSNWWLFLLLLMLVMLRGLMLYFQFPITFYSLEIFNPHYYASSQYFPSLGDLLISTLFILFFVVEFHRLFTIRFTTIQKSNFYKNKLVVMLLFTVSLFFIAIHYLLYSIMYNSSIMLEVFKVLDFSVFSLISFLIIALLLISFILFTDKIIKESAKIVSLKNFLIIAILIELIISIAMILLSLEISYFEILFLILTTIIIAFVRFVKKQYNNTYFLTLLLLTAIYTVNFITVENINKENEIRKVLVVKLATERDPVAELLISNLDEKMNSDKVLKTMLEQDPYGRKIELIEHLRKTYFSGYWDKYDLQLSICNNNDSLLVQPDNQLCHCYSLFNKMFNEQGIQLAKNNYYFINNQNGRISYIGVKRFLLEENKELKLFIELDSKLVSGELGYPELLLDNKTENTSLMNMYSYAKYKNNKLITKSGDYPYNLINNYTNKSTKDFTFQSIDGYNHLIYNIDNQTTIVISKPTLSVINVLTSFTYIFLFFYLLLNIGNYVVYPNKLTNFKFDLKNKIKISMIFLILLSLIVIGISTVYYNIKQYQNNHIENIREKIQSVLVEIENKLSNEPKLTPEMRDYINYLLVKFSSVFYSDINLYDLRGNLLATSRPEVFEQCLISEKMNLKAYQELVINSKPQFIHNENIGELEYLSAYVPFYNSNNQILAYLNLPYFTKQSLLKKEITNFVVAIINIYVLLIFLAIVIAVFVSNKITQPLQLIRNKFRKIQLGKKNEMITYKTQDEIGDLIKEYNRMVNELSESANRLAQSEREAAWGEMAKQIAHEIKNPLTPMKLSMQLLQRSWENKDSDFETRLQKVSETLIEQIETLASIANEFSNFAKMPKTNLQKIDIIAKAKSSINLFENTKNIKIDFNANNISEIFILADKEQLLQVFNNLIQNAIQAVPENIKGNIKLDISQHSQLVQVKITDNGKGISDEIKDRLFQPNFTTKTSGMGLGLAITRKIIENANGKIWFETEANKGTSFYFVLPILQ